jgi:hypothetical protein
MDSEPHDRERVGRVASQHLCPTPLDGVGERVVEREHLTRDRAETLRERAPRRALDDSEPAGRLVVRHGRRSALRDVFEASGRPGCPEQGRLAHVDRVRQLAGRGRRRIACRVEVDAAAQRDRRDRHVLPAGDRACAPHRLGLGVEVLHDVDVGERVDLRRDRVAHPIPRLELRPRAVQLGEVDLRASEERCVGERLGQRRSDEIDELPSCCLRRRRSV